MFTFYFRVNRACPHSSLARLSEIERIFSRDGCFSFLNLELFLYPLHLEEIGNIVSQRSRVHLFCPLLTKGLPFFHLRLREGQIPVAPAFLLPSLFSTPYLLSYSRNSRVAPALMVLKFFYPQDVI